MISNKTFENVLILIIIISSILLSFDNPLNEPNTPKIKFFNFIDLLFTGIFAVEALLKIVAQGFYFNGEESYLKITWNILDFLIVCESLLSLSFGDGASKFRILRLMKVLRPLRMISRNKGLQISIKALF